MGVISWFHVMHISTKKKKNNISNIRIGRYTAPTAEMPQFVFLIRSSLEYFALGVISWTVFTIPITLFVSIFSPFRIRSSPHRVVIIFSEQLRNIYQPAAALEVPGGKGGERKGKKRKEKKPEVRWSPLCGWEERNTQPCGVLVYRVSKMMPRDTPLPSAPGLGLPRGLGTSGLEQPGHVAPQALFFFQPSTV